MTNNTPQRLAYVGGEFPATAEALSEQFYREGITIAEAVDIARTADRAGYVNVGVTAYDADDMTGETFHRIDWRNWVHFDEEVGAYVQDAPPAPVEADDAPSDAEQDEAAAEAHRAAQEERYAPTENVLQGAALYISGAVGYLERHPYAALSYIRSARSLLDQAEALLIDAANR